MKPWELLGEARTPEGDLLTLMRQDREYLILASGKPLMSSRMHGSEEALAEFGLDGARQLLEPTVLVGGLGMGFTLRAALDRLPPDAHVVVAEMIPAVVEWQRTHLGGLANRPLEDPRVELALGDVAAVIAASRDRFDAILLDVDNGPDAFTASRNAGLYGDPGIAAIRTALNLGGTLAVWSAWEDRRFEQRLRYGRFEVRVERVRARLKRGGPRHTIFLAQKV